MNNTGLGIESSPATINTSNSEYPLATSENGALVPATGNINLETPDTLEASENHEARQATAEFFEREEEENRLGLSLTHPGYLGAAASILIAGGLQVTEVGRTLNISPREVQEIVTVTACCLIPSMAFLGGSLYFYYKVAKGTVGVGKAIVGKVAEVGTNLRERVNPQAPQRDNKKRNQPTIKPIFGPASENRAQNTQQQAEMRPAVRAEMIEEFYKELVNFDSTGFPAGGDVKAKKDLFALIFKYIPNEVTTLTLQGQTINRPDINPNQRQVVWNDGNLIRHLNHLRSPNRS